MLTRSIVKSSVWFHLSWIGWTIAAILFMVAPRMPAISPVVVVSLVFSTFLIFKTPLLGLYLLPLPFMIGPVFSCPIGVVSVTAGDLYTVIFIFRTLFLRSLHSAKSEPLFLLLGMVLLVMSAAFSKDLGASVVGLAKILQYAFLARASIILIKQPFDLRNLLTAWVFITTLCAIMMLWNFYNYRPQMIFWGEDSIADISINLERSDVLFRPTFFYTNVWIPIGLSILYSLIGVLMKVEPCRFRRLFLGMTIPINFLVLLMNNARAMLAPVAVLSVMIILWFFWKSLTRAKKNLFGALSSVLIMCASIWFFAGFLITAPQRIALLGRFNNFASVTMRWSVWTAILPKILNDPIRLFFGWGPQSTTRQGEMMHDQNLLTGSLGNTEGAFDSTFIGFLVEYGVVFSNLIFRYIALCLFRIWRYYKLTKDTLALAMLVMSAALIFAHIFQQYGLNPPGLMALQVFAFLPMLKRLRKKAI